MTETVLWPSLSLVEVLQTLQEARQNIPALNPDDFCQYHRLVIYLSAGGQPA